MPRANLDATKKRKLYPRQKLLDALEAVRGGRPLREVSVEYGVPKTTLMSKFKGTHPIDGKSGPPPVLDEAEERCLVDWVEDMSELGFAIKKSQMCGSVQTTLRELKRKNIFSDDKPGHNWYKNFEERHSQIIERFRKNLSYAKTAPLEISVRNWFVKMKRYLDEHNLYEIKPSRIFTCEEAAFIFNPDGKKVLVRKGDRNDFSFAHNHVNECATSFFTANATGTLAPPMIVFKQERIKPGIVAALPESWTIGTTSDGWMTKESFHEYLKVFDQWLTQCGIQRPVVMFIDANSVFPTQSLSALCSSLEIHLLPIHPNMGHILQPLDNLFLDALKETWLIVTDQWRTNNDRKRVRKEHFAELLWESLKMVESVGTITEGFKACGIHPFSADAVDYGRKGRFKMQTIIRPKEEEKFEETKMIVDPQFAPEEVRSHLEFLEDFIDDETLKSFREAESFEIWTGEMRDASLFCLWRKLRKMSHTGDNYNDFEGNSEAGASGGHFMRMDDSFQSTGIIKSEIEDQFDGNFTTWMDNSLEQS